MSASGFENCQKNIPSPVGIAVRVTGYGFGRKSQALCASIFEIDKINLRTGAPYTFLSPTQRPGAI
jgi:hypothetical protein